VIAGAAPLLGLLGTVTGMISLFEVITHYGTGDPKILAGGISEALITTQTGLATAIPILLIHNWLRNQSLHIQSEMEKHAIRILNRLWPETA
jgi:biopolymer transport protein ExbB